MANIIKSIGETVKAKDGRILTTENAVAATNQVNGFTIEVQEIDKNEVNGLKRRQAVGKNAQGVILVKGDASFSAEDTILINELAYYIKSNDLKAY